MTRNRKQKIFYFEYNLYYILGRINNPVSEGKMDQWPSLQDYFSQKLFKVCSSTVWQWEYGLHFFQLPRRSWTCLQINDYGIDERFNWE